MGYAFFDEDVVTCAAGVFLHVLADALGSVVVIISALVIWLSDWEYRCGNFGVVVIVKNCVKELT